MLGAHSQMVKFRRWTRYELANICGVVQRKHYEEAGNSSDAVRSAMDLTRPAGRQRRERLFTCVLHVLM
jgi:hypothetical protein